MQPNKEKEKRWVLKTQQQQISYKQLKKQNKNNETTAILNNFFYIK